MPLKKLSELDIEQKNVVRLFLFIPLLLIIVFYIMPVIMMIFYSLTNFNGYSDSYDFVGLENYQNVFSTETIDSFKTIPFYLLSALFQFIIGVYLAIFVFFQKRFKNVLIFIIILPLFINTVALGLSFVMVLRPLGAFDQILNFLGFYSSYTEADTIKWLGDLEVVNYTLATITMWKYTPFTFLLIYSAFNSVNKTLIKSAILQGASKLQLVRYILIPNTRLTLKLVIFMLLVGSITALEIPKIMTGGSLETSTVLIRVSDMAFSMRNYGLASVLTMVVIALIFLTLLVVWKAGNKNERV